jgi:hypothetical protein
VTGVGVTISNVSTLAWGARAAIVFAVAGVFGTWRSSGPVSLDGFQGPHNGWLVIVFGLIALLGVGPAARGSWVGILLVLGCGAAMTYGAVESLADDGSVLGGSSGWGVWLTTAASVALALAAVAAATRRLAPPAAKAS